MVSGFCYCHALASLQARVSLEIDVVVASCRKRWKYCWLFLTAPVERMDSVTVDRLETVPGGLVTSDLLFFCAFSCSRPPYCSSLSFSCFLTALVSALICLAGYLHYLHISLVAKFDLRRLTLRCTFLKFPSLLVCYQSWAEGLLVDSSRDLCNQRWRLLCWQCLLSSLIPGIFQNAAISTFEAVVKNVSTVFSPLFISCS